MTSFTRLAAMLLALPALLLSGRAALAQQAQTISGSPGELQSTMRQLDDANDARRLQMEYYMARLAAMHQRAPLKPYSGQQVTETRRQLADGNEISSRDAGMHYRDSHGRTRHELSMANGRKAVIIIDPAAQVAYMIRPDREDVLRVSGPARAPQPTIPGAAVPASPLRTSVTTQLGDKEMAGVMATGMRSESTIPAGAQGNAQEIHVSYESWRSRELAIPIYFHMADPRNGERTTYYEKLTVGEPADEVFSLPAGYPVHDVAGSQAAL